MHLGRPSICSDAGIASVLHRELNLTRQESQEAIVEPPGSDSHAVVVWGGWSEMFTLTRFPFIGTRKTDYLPKGKVFRLFLQNCLYFHFRRYKYPKLRRTDKVALDYRNRWPVATDGTETLIEQGALVVCVFSF